MIYISEKGEVKKIRKGECVTISDDAGNKKMIHGSMEGFAVRQTTSIRRNIVIRGLDKSWLGKKALNIRDCFTHLPYVCIGGDVVAIIDIYFS